MASLRILLTLVFLSSIFAQKTYRRACDCEYTIEGKCAYTLLLPKGQNTCAQEGSTGAAGGNSPDHMTSDAMASLLELQTNVSMLWSTSGDQARMLNQLQSMFITHQDNMHTMLENMTTMMSHTAMNMMNSSMNNPMNMNNMNNMNNMKMPGNITENIMMMMSSNISNVMNQAMASLQAQSAQMGQLMAGVEERFANQKQIVDSLNKDVENLTQTLNGRMESLHQKIKRNYFLCHQKGLLVSGSRVNIPDESISASSQFNENHKPPRSRINTMADAADYGAWCPAEPNLNEWIQLDLGKPRTIYGVVTRGRPDYEQWVTQYKLQYTETLAEDPSETVWVTYKDLLEDDMLFAGNFDQNTQKINELLQPIRVRHIRIVPTAAYQDSNKCMRVDLLGCVDSP